MEVVLQSVSSSSCNAYNSELPQSQTVTHDNMDLHAAQLVCLPRVSVPGLQKNKCGNYTLIFLHVLGRPGTKAIL